MNLTKLLKTLPLVMTFLLLLMFCGVNSVAANTGVTADKWQSELTIYGWFPSLDGDLKFKLPGGGGNVSVDTSQILDSLNFVFMGTYEGRYNKWAFGVDLLYMDVSGSENTTANVGPGPGVPVSVSGGLSLKSWFLSGIVGYDVVQTNKARFTLIGGLRYLELDADVNLSVNGPLPPTPPPANINESVGILDGIVGIKGSYMLSEHWYVPYYADIGTGDSKMTWQLFAGIGYMFNWGDIRLGYRYLEYDQDDDKFLQDLSFSGPLLGVGFRF